MLHIANASQLKRKAGSYQPRVPFNWIIDPSNTFRKQPNLIRAFAKLLYLVLTSSETHTLAFSIALSFLPYRIYGQCSNFTQHWLSQSYQINKSSSSFSLHYGHTHQRNTLLSLSSYIKILAMQPVNLIHLLKKSDHFDESVGLRITLQNS